MTMACSRKALNGTAGSGEAAPGVAGVLGLAAAPVFALMALWTALSGTPDMLCASMGGASSIGGMTLMYLLMSVFHIAPWLRLFARR
jgi:hypothetical protein